MQKVILNTFSFGLKTMSKGSNDASTDFYPKISPEYLKNFKSGTTIPAMVFHEVRALARADIVGSFAHYRFRVIDQFWGSHTKNQLPMWFLSAI